MDSAQEIVNRYADRQIKMVVDEYNQVYRENLAYAIDFLMKYASDSEWLLDFDDLPEEWVAQYEEDFEYSDTNPNEVMTYSDPKKHAEFLMGFVNFSYPDLKDLTTLEADFDDNRYQLSISKVFIEGYCYLNNLNPARFGFRVKDDGCADFYEVEGLICKASSIYEKSNYRREGNKLIYDGKFALKNDPRWECVHYLYRYLD